MNDTLRHMADAPRITEIAGTMGDLVTNWLPMMIPLFVVPFVFFGITRMWRLFRDVAAHTPSVGVSEHYRRPVEISTKSEPSKAMLVIEAAAEKVATPRPVNKRPCDCPVCREGWAQTKPELTPPSFEDWQNWEYYGLIKPGSVAR